MTRYVLTADVTINLTGSPAGQRVYRKGHTVELSAAEVTAITSAGGSVRSTTARDVLGEGAAASNSD